MDRAIVDSYLAELGFTFVGNERWRRETAAGVVVIQLVSLADTEHVEVRDGNDVLYARYAVQGNERIHLKFIRKAVQKMDEQQKAQSKYNPFDHLIGLLTEATGQQWRKMEHADEVFVKVFFGRAEYGFSHNVHLMWFDRDPQGYADGVAIQFKNWMATITENRQTFVTDPREAKPL